MQEGSRGADWYERTRAGFREAAGNDPAKMDMFAAENALWSPLADPDPNLGWALQAHNAYEVGRPAFSVRDTTKARTYNTSRDAGLGGQEIPQGKKTGVYRQNINPNEPKSVTGVNDTWHAKAMGFDEEEIRGGLGAPVHRYLDGETMLAIDRANRFGYGGRNDWDAQSVQAAPWVASKAAGLIEKGRVSNMEEAMEIANRTPTDAFPKYTAFGTYEAVPGAGTGHMDELVGQDFATRERFTLDPRASWQSPSGNDEIYNALGMYNLNTNRMTGAYTPEGGQLEINPGFAARPLVSFEPGQIAAPGVEPAPNPRAEPGKVIDEASQEMLNAAEAFRAYVDMQNAGAWHKPVVGNKAAVSSGATVSGNAPLSEIEMRRLQAVLEPYGLGAADTGQGVTLMDFADDASGKKMGGLLGNEKKPGPLAKSLDEALPGRRVDRAHVQGGYIDYQPVSGKENAGKGLRTEKLQEYLKNPKLLAKLDASPRIREIAQNRIALAEEMAQKGYSVRQDQIEALRLIAEGGPSLLFKRWREGAILPAVALMTLATFTDDEEGEGGS